MKYQNFAVIFVLIVLPLSLVLSYYIQNQTDTIVAQTNYQTKLNDSAYDAIAAYQINSLNTQSVQGESIRSYVLASVNTFFTTLATNFGMSSASKSRLQNYVPAILFTTYDGYYIYSPIKTKQVAINTANGQGVLTDVKDIVYAKKSSPESAYMVDNSTATSVANGGNIPGTLTTSTDDAKDQKNYMLKPFIYYSAKYKKGLSTSLVASYSLDNYLTVYGQKSDNRDQGAYVGKEFSKSGYLIDPSKVEVTGTLMIKLLAKIDSNGQVTGDTQSAADISGYRDIIETNKNTSSLQKNNVRYLNINIPDQKISPAGEDYNFINYYNYKQNETYSRNDLAGYNGNVKTYSPNKVTKITTSSNTTGNLRSIRNQIGDNIITDTIEINKLIEDSNDAQLQADAKQYLLYDSDNYSKLRVFYNGVEITDREAQEYYIQAWYFSRWVKRNLNDIEAQDVDLSYLNLPSLSTNTKLSYMDFTNDTTKIFDIGSTNDPESERSFYQEHKRGVIKNSIQYNLNSAISTYNDTFYDLEHPYRLPIMSDNDWDDILNNVSIAAFLQGIPAGTKTFNSYTVVKSNNNNTSVSIDNMYFTDENQWDNRTSNYHMYDCPELELTTADNYKAGMSAEFRYDAARILTKVVSDTDPTIVALYEDETNTYYEVVKDTDGEITFGPEISKNTTDASNIFAYNKDGTTYDLTKLPNGKLDPFHDVYKYDHKNLACYTCSISKNYTPVVKYYRGDLRRTYATNDADLLIEMTAGNRDFVYFKDGTTYTGPVISEGDMAITTQELQKRRYAVYTYLAKIRNSLYKNNAYINR